MKEKTLVTLTATPQVQVKASGDLALKGHERQEVSAVSRYTGNLTMRQEGDVLQIVCLDDCSLTVPTGSTIIIERAAGDARISNVTGSLKVQNVGGDLALFETGQVEIEKVGGDLLAHHLHGGFTIQQIGGDFTGDDIQGIINCGKVGGDIVLRQAGGSFEGRAGGDLRLGLVMTKLPVCNLRCGGDIQFFIPSGSSGVLNIISNGEDIQLNLGNDYKSIEERSYNLTLGEGGDQLTLQAGGDVTISDQPWTEEVIPDYADNMDMESLHQLDEEVSAHVERATRRAQEAAHRAEQRIQSAMNRMEQARWGTLGDRIHGRVMEKFNRKFGEPVDSPVPPHDAVTDEERLMVLKMVQDKKITVEEAEKLLRSMEGKH